MRGVVHVPLVSALCDTKFVRQCLDPRLVLSHLRFASLSVCLVCLCLCLSVCLSRSVSAPGVCLPLAFFYFFFLQRAIQLDADMTYAYTLCGHEYVANEDFDKVTKPRDTTVCTGVLFGLVRPRLAFGAGAAVVTCAPCLGV